MLGHGMCRLDPRPGRANSIAPRKRPLNNTCCMLVRTPDRDVAVGLPGGRWLIAASARAAHLLIRRGLTGHQVATAPRMHVGMSEPVEITHSAGKGTMEGLEAMGHTVVLKERIAGVMNCAEVLRGESRVRAGSGQFAAGVD